MKKNINKILVCSFILAGSLGMVGEKSHAAMRGRIYNLFSSIFSSCRGGSQKLHHKIKIEVKSSLIDEANNMAQGGFKSGVSAKKFDITNHPSIEKKKWYLQKKSAGIEGKVETVVSIEKPKVIDINDGIVKTRYKDEKGNKNYGYTYGLPTWNKGKDIIEVQNKLNKEKYAKSNNIDETNIDLN